MMLPLHRWGDPAAPVLLCLHGFMGSGGDWAALAAALVDDVQIVAPDLPGHGAATLTADPTFDATVTQLATLVAAIAYGQPISLLGYSLGGRLALALALRRPAAFRHVILEGVSPGLADPEARAARARWDAAMAARLEQQPLAQFLADWYALPLFATLRADSRYPEVLARRLHNDPQQLARAMRGLGTGQMPSLWAAWAETQLPALLIAGEHDAKYRQMTSDMLAHNPAALAAIIADAGHNSHFEQPARFAAVVRRYLAA